MYITAYREEDNPPPDYRDLTEKLRKALEADPRVTAIRSGPHPDDVSYGPFYPVPEDEVDLILAPVKAREPEAYVPFKFTVKVPSKNQPQLDGPEDLPETYEARWNCSTLMVFWREEKRHRKFMPGGQVVRDVVSEAAAKAGYPVRVQGPSMAHVDLRIKADPTAGSILWTRSPSDREIFDLTFPLELDDQRIADLAFGHLSSLASYYYKMENISERAGITERALNDSVEELLLLEHARSISGFDWKHPIESVRFWWDNRGWRGRASEAIASIWLSTARLQGLIGEWSELHRFYRTLVSEKAGFDPFETYVSDMREEFGGYTFDLPTKIVEHSEGKIGVYYLVVATVLSAIAGAVFGAIAGHYAR